MPRTRSKSKRTKSQKSSKDDEDPDDQNNDGVKTGAGDDSGQKTNAGDNSGNNSNFNLTSEHIDALAESVGEKLGLSAITETLSTLTNELTNFKKTNSSEITGAIKRLTADLNKDSGQTGKGGKDDANLDITNQQITVGNETLTVADLMESHQKSLVREQELAQQEITRKAEDKVRSIGDALRAKNFGGMVDVLAKGMADQIVTDDNGNLIASKVQVTNSLGTVVTKDVPLDEYLDIIAKTNPAMIRDTTKTGGNSGGGGGGGNEGEFTAEKATMDIAVYDKWMEADPEGCLAAMKVYQDQLANGLQS